MVTETAKTKMPNRYVQLLKSLENERAQKSLCKLNIVMCDCFKAHILSQKYSVAHKKRILRLFNKYFADKTFMSPIEINQYIDNLQHNRKHIINAIRLYLNFLEKYEIISDKIILKYRKVLVMPRSRSDVYSPSNEEVKYTYFKVRDHRNLSILYLVLMTSGIRITEAVDFLQSYDPTKLNIQEEYGYYTVASTRGTKTVNNIYLPKFVCDRLHHISNTYQSLRMRMIKRKTNLSLKYLRKWQYNFMLYHGVPESVADFIQGRNNRSISSTHYLAKSQQAEFWYGKIAEKFQQIIKLTEAEEKKTQKHIYDFFLIFPL